MPAARSPLNGVRTTYKKVTLTGAVVYDANGDPYILSLDGYGLQSKISLKYLPVGVQVADVASGQEWWIDNSTNLYTWTLDKAVGSFIPMASIQSIFQTMYPVGALWHSTLSDNPNTLPQFSGTTWIAYAEGLALVGVGTGNDGHSGQTFSAGVQQGEYSHQLTGLESGVASHGHTVTDTHSHDYNEGATSSSSSAQSPGYNTLDHLVSAQTSGTNSGSIVVNSASATNATNYHNTVQPSMPIYVWKRTA